MYDETGNVLNDGSANMKVMLSRIIFPVRGISIQNSLTSW